MTPKQKYVPLWVSPEMRHIAKINATIEGKPLNAWLNEVIRKENENKKNGKRSHETFW